jgi:mannose-6-phosphate isomerase-like protein (cupin superfamily)
MELKNVCSELAAHPEGTFLDLVPFNQSNISACSITGTSPLWEMHPDTDEFFYILEGEFEITLLQRDGQAHFVAPSGSTFVVPKGIWHKPAAPQGAKFLYLTPGETRHSEALPSVHEVVNPAH